MQKANYSSKHYGLDKSCLKYDVLIHGGMESLVNDFDNHPSITMNVGEGTLVLISKTKLDTIATNENPCTKNEKLIMTECILKQVLLE